VKREGEAGSLVMFGLGGIFVEVMRDVQFRLAPLSIPEAEEMIRSIRGFPILKGTRGEKGVDIERLSEILVKLSILATDFPTIEEMDLNPVFARESGKETVVVDVRLKVRE
jgi:acyl-CoA synthetase (NDP forming)